MLYKRQRKLLHIIKYGNCDSKTKIFKLAFLLKEAFTLNANEFYDFVPYNFGAYSFQLQKDLDKLVEMGVLGIDNGVYVTDDDSEEESFEAFLSQYKNDNAKNLTNKIYNEYPYYTLNSTIHEHTYNLDNVDNDNVSTIGYEGQSIDSFINRLIQSRIQVVADIRANPLSRKYGFSQQQLDTILTKMGIDYCSVKSLGVPTEIRKQLNNISKEEYLEMYEEALLYKQLDIADLSSVVNKQSTALLCFEADYKECHRSVLADNLYSQKKIIHL